MKQRRTAVMFLAIMLSAGAYASGGSNDLKPLAIQVSEAAKQIAKDAGGIKSADNPTSARRDLNLRVVKLEKMAEPLGLASEKPYGYCGVMVRNLFGFIDASAGTTAESKFYFDSYRTSEKDCQEQITDKPGNAENDNLAILDL